MPAYMQQRVSTVLNAERKMSFVIWVVIEIKMRRHRTHDWELFKAVIGAWSFVPMYIATGITSISSGNYLNNWLIVSKTIFLQDMEKVPV